MTKKAEEKANNDCALRIYYEVWMLHKQGQKKVQEKNQNAAEMKLFCSNNGKSEFL